MARKIEVHGSLCKSEVEKHAWIFPFLKFGEGYFVHTSLRDHRGSSLLGSGSTIV